MLNHFASSASVTGSDPGEQVQRHWKPVLTKTRILVEKHVDKLRGEHWEYAEKKNPKSYLAAKIISSDEVSHNTHNMLHFQ